MGILVTYSTCVCMDCYASWNQHYLKESSVVCAECNGSNIDFVSKEIYEADPNHILYEEVNDLLK